MNEYSDEFLAQQAQTGDGTAYETLVTRHYQRVYGVCVGIVADTHEAQDLCQETMLQGFVKINRLRDCRRIGGWLVEIARNLCIDRLRKLKQNKKYLAAQTVETETTFRPDAVDISDAISKLPLELRLPLMMYYFDGRDNKTIAEQLGVSPSTMCRRLREARRCLYELLNEVKP